MPSSSDNESIVGQTTLATTQILEERFEQTNRVREQRINDLERSVKGLRRLVLLLFVIAAALGVAAYVQWDTLTQHSHPELVPADPAHSAKRS